jgi:hypothetical protein
MKNFEIKHNSTDEKTYQFHWKCVDNDSNISVDGFVYVEIDEVNTAYELDRQIIIDDFVKSKLDVLAIEDELVQKISEQLK